MKTHFLLLLCLSFFSLTSGIAQQLPYSSAFSDRGFIWNPAMTASWDYLEVGLNYRQQWLGFDSAPRTASLSGQVPLVNNNMSIGGFFMNDQLGNLTTNTIALTYAYRFKLGISSGDQLSIGILGIANQFRSANRDLIVNDLDDNLLQEGEDSKMIPNIGAGLYYCTSSGEYFDQSHFYFGISVSEILPQELIFTELNQVADFQRPMQASAIIGARFVPSYDFYFEPTLLVNHSFEGITHFALNLKLELAEKGWVGGLISSDSTIGFQGGIYLNNFSNSVLKIGGLGTYNLGQLGKYQGPGFEVFIAYHFLL